jgi:hypothetical protein
MPPIQLERDPLAAGAGAAARTVPRDHAFDLVKGVLVAMMVVYHTLNVVAVASEEVYGYVRFVSGSFIYVTGLLIARHVSAGFDADALAATRKLVLRGVKLIALFTLLNLAIQAAGLGSAARRQVGVSGFLAQADRVFLLGDARFASFVILLPIGYLLMAAPLFLRAAGPRRPVASAAVLATALAIGGLAPWGHVGSAVIEFMVVGIVGMCVGALTRDRPLDRPEGGPACALGLAAAIVLTASVYFNLALYAIGVALVIHFLYGCVRRLDARLGVTRMLLLLGRYSLFAYIAQLVLIRLLAWALGSPQWTLGGELALFCVTTLGLLVATCAALAWARERFATVDRSYRWVFA